MQLTQPKDTKRHAEEPATASQALAPPSGNDFGSIHGFIGGFSAFSASWVCDEGFSEPLVWRSLTIAASGLAGLGRWLGSRALFASGNEATCEGS